MDLRNFSGSPGAYRTSDGKSYENSNEAYNHQTDVDFAAQHPEVARAEAAFVGEQAAFLYQVGLLIGAIIIYVLMIPLMVIVVPCVIIADYGFFILSLFPLIILKQAFDDTKQTKFAFHIEYDLHTTVHSPAALAVNLIMYVFGFAFLRPISKLVKQMLGTLSTQLRKAVIIGMVALSVVGLALSTLDRSERLVHAQEATLSVPIAQDSEGIALYSASPLLGIHRGKVLENLSGGELQVQGISYVPLYGAAALVLGDAYYIASLGPYTFTQKAKEFNQALLDKIASLVKSITQLRQFKVVTADGTTGYVDVAAFPYDTWRSGPTGFGLLFSQIWLVQFFKTHNIVVPAYNFYASHPFAHITSMFSKQIFPALIPSLISLLIYLVASIAGLIALCFGLKKLNANLQLKAFYAAQQGTEQGDAAAMAAMGDYYYWGNYVEQDREKAFDLYAKAAEQGDTTAQSRMGDVYDIGGYGVEQDKQKAVEWWTKSASHKGASAYTLAQLGNCYQNGIGVPADDKKAVEYFTAAAKQGNVGAMVRLGAYYYEEGRGIDKDWGKSAEWFYKAAKRGDPQAQYMLGFFYAEGAGIHKDETKAIEWLGQAVTNGVQEADELLQDLHYKRYKPRISRADRSKNKAYSEPDYNQNGVSAVLYQLIGFLILVFVANLLRVILAAKLKDGSNVAFIIPIAVLFLVAVGLWNLFKGKNKIWKGVWGIVCLGVFLFLFCDFTSNAKPELMNSIFQKAGIEKTDEE
jgi:TPR repeat protein